MIDGLLVINPVAHAYNLSDANIRNKFGATFRDILWWLHDAWNPEHLKVPKSVYYSDWSAEALAKTLFLETDVDLAANMNLRLDSWFNDGLCAAHKNVEVAERWPDRFFTYVGVDPTAGVETCLRELEEQMEQLPDSVGLKLYPDQVEPLRSWRLDDPKVAFPILERAQELGIKTIAIHKALANGPVPLAPYRIDDIDIAAIQFPELSFEIIHAGMAFTEETSQAIGRFHNVYANLEITSLLLHKAPGWFDEVMCSFLGWGPTGADKIIWSDGTLFAHSQPLLEAFMAWQPGDAARYKFGIEEVTREQKAQILGRNWARIVGLDADAALAKIADDDFTQAQQRNGLEAPYSNWMAIAADEGLVPA